MNYASKLSRRILENEIVYCDHCKDEVGKEFKVEGEILCRECAAKKRMELDEEWNKVFDQIENGEIETLPGEQRLHEIHLQILDIDLGY